MEVCATTPDSDMVSLIEFYRTGEERSTGRRDCPGEDSEESFAMKGEELFTRHTGSGHYRQEEYLW